LGGWKWLILIPEGRGGWGWLKFSVEMRKAIVFLSAKVGCGSGSPSVSVKDEGKEEVAKLGLVPHWKGPSFVEVLRSGTVPITGGSRSKLSAASAEPCALDLLLSLRHEEEEFRSVVDCFSLESPSSELLDIDKPFCPLGKKFLAHTNLKFEFSKRHVEQARQRV
jgi:hypothetical protein